MTPYTLPLLFAATILAILTVLAWQRRYVKGTIPFIWLMLAVIEWTLAYVLELESAGLSTKVFWVRIQYFGIVSVPVTWLVFALQHTGRERWLTRRNILLLVVIPSITLLMTWTNQEHHLMTEKARLVTDGPVPMLELTRGAWFWVHTAYSYLLLLLGSILLIQECFRFSRPFRRQTIALLIGASAPWAGNAAYLLNLTPFPNLDLTSFAFMISGLALSWALFRFQLLDLVPVARDRIVESMEDGVIVTDVQDRVVDLNPTIEDILGCTASEVVGQPIEQGLSDWPDHLAPCCDVTEARKEITMGGTETPRTYELSVSPLYSSRDRPLGRLIVLRDITKRKQAEEALHQRAVELQARNDELYAFARTVAHDLKEPLTSIVGYAEILETYYAPMLNEEVRSHLRAITQRGHKMGSIIDELLLLSSVRRKQDVEVSVLNMGDIVDEAKKRVEALVKEHRAEIITPENWPAALGYGPWVEEVWVNYLSNAIKYGGRPPRVELGADKQQDGTIRCWVRDNGPGLTAEEKERLFTPFTQLGKTSTMGHGLGLSIVRRIVTKLGGQVDVESRVGQGSLFSFTLDAADQPSSTQGPDSSDRNGRQNDDR